MKALSLKLIRNRWNLARGYLRRETISRGFPLELGIELTNHCNADCIMCPRQQMTRQRGFMEISLFKKIIDEAKEYTELAYLHLAGESLLHPDLIEMIDYCGLAGINTTLSTNAQLLDSEMSRRLIDSRLDMILLALDGASKATYSRIKRGLEYDHVVQNIENFIEMKAKARRAPYAVVQLIYQKENMHEVDQYRKLWGQSKADMVRIKPCFYYPGMDDNHGVSAGKVRSMKPCMLLWRQLAICWDGTIVACCMDFLAQVAVGNVGTESIKEAWNGDKMLWMRELHGRGECEQTSLSQRCSGFRLGLPHAMVGILMDDLSIKKMMPRFERYSLFRRLKVANYYE